MSVKPHFYVALRSSPDVEPDWYWSVERKVWVDDVTKAVGFDEREEAEAVAFSVAVEYMDAAYGVVYVLERA